MNVYNSQPARTAAVDTAVFDIYVKWPDGRITKPQMVAAQDIHSGKVLGWTLSPVKNGEAA
jgi:putative transposase